MKRYLLIIALAAVLAACGRAQENDAWRRGNEAYTSGEYSKAIAAYNEIRETGMESHKLFYNLGNAYFRDGQLGEAILNYHRALRLRPNNADALYNLKIAESRVRVRIEPLPQFFASRWLFALRAAMSSNGWAWMCLGALAAALAAALIYLLAQKRMWRKTGFYCGLATVVVCVVALFFALSERHRTLHSPDAIVMQRSATARTSPDDTGKDAFILYEGTWVRVTAVLGDWSEVEIPDGNKGWVNTTAIEAIR